MSREVVWTLRKFTLLCEQGMLSDEDCSILCDHIKRCTHQDIAIRHNVDVSVIDAKIKRFKLVYDAVQKEFPDILEPRKKAIFRRKKPVK